MTAPTKTPEEIAAEEAEAAAHAAESGTGGVEPSQEELDALADKGKQALDRMKAEKKALAADLAQYKALGLDPARLKELIGASETAAASAEQERTRREAETAALGKANDRLIRAEVKAAATGKLADPAMAAQDLAGIGVDVSSFDVDDDGNVDSAAITAAITDLITKRPYLAAQSDRRFQGGADAGPRNTPAGKPQLTQADLDRMNAAKDYAGIAKAREEGRCDDLLGITRT